MDLASQEFQRMTMHESRSQITPPPVAKKPTSTYRAGYTKYSSPGMSSYESRQQEAQTLVQPSGRYEREVKQATYSVQSTDSSGKSSPHSTPYSTYGFSPNYGTQSVYNSGPSPTTYGGQPNVYPSSGGQYGSYSPTMRSGSPSYAQTGSYPTMSSYSPTPAPQDSGSGVTYASIADMGVTYAQIKPRSERNQPGPQIPIQIKVQDSRQTDNAGYMTPSQAQYLRHSPVPASSAPPTAQMSSRLQPDNRGGNLASKEQEVDALTQLLMQGLEGTKDPDFYGICAKCGKKVVGENNGCTAMDQIFHIACFVCIGCGTLLRGKSFYAMETKPHCEPCYLNTLEKCSICSKPITDRLLRATGKPYHPACFTCVVCGKSLDGIPFTVDATNQIHCIEDFHRKFAPRCCVCQKPIMPEQGQDSTVRVVAMDRSFHINCYRCEDCGDLLSSEAEGRGCYPLDDHILCKTCNARRINALTTKLSTEL
ncbi:lipoma-preferred partner homolog isoform X2 [Dreissena polymorpha]|uniref:lipoma-preferred partner homolog isoform X2 n=1 Tax=Dreissena polymorpha TaxID=45954 RepID=UPI00226440F1|nr:lipoma-preferred partner homolog isoform X2 [Dreissena polymorpha]